MDRSRDYHIKGSKSDREGQVLYCVTYMWNLKNETNELIYRIEIDSQMWRANLWLPGGIAGWGNRRIRSSRLTYTHCYV